MQAGGPQTEQIIGGSPSVSSFIPASHRGENQERGVRGGNVRKWRRQEPKHWGWRVRLPENV